MGWDGWRDSGGIGGNRDAASGGRRLARGRARRTPDTGRAALPQRGGNGGRVCGAATILHGRRRMRPRRGAHGSQRPGRRPPLPPGEGEGPDEAPRPTRVRRRAHRDCRHVARPRRGAKAKRGSGTRPPVPGSAGRGGDAAEAERGAGHATTDRQGGRSRRHRAPRPGAATARDHRRRNGWPRRRRERRPLGGAAGAGPVWGATARGGASSHGPVSAQVACEGTVEETRMSLAHSAALSWKSPLCPDRGERGSTGDTSQGPQ